VVAQVFAAASTRPDRRWWRRLLPARIDWFLQRAGPHISMCVLMGRTRDSYCSVGLNNSKFVWSEFFYIFFNHFAKLYDCLKF
jgi:hypothetical protein